MIDKALVDYFIEKTDERFDKLETETAKRFDKFEMKLDALNEFKWMLIGGSAITSAIISVLIVIFSK